MFFLLCFLFSILQKPIGNYSKTGENFELLNFPFAWRVPRCATHTFYLKMEINRQRRFQPLTRNDNNIFGKYCQQLKNYLFKTSNEIRMLFQLHFILSLCLSHALVVDKCLAVTLTNNCFAFSHPRKPIPEIFKNFFTFSFFLDACRP